MLGLGLGLSRINAVKSIDPTLVCWIPMISKYAIGQTLIDRIAGNNAPASGNPVIGADDTTFDGSDAFTIPSSFNDTFKGDFSICIWLKPDDGQPTGIQYLLGDYVDTKGRFQIVHFATGEIRFNFYGNDDYEYITSDLAIFPDGTTERTHITITGDQSEAEFKLHVNGIFESTTSANIITPANWALFNSTTNQIFLGDHDNAVGSYVGKQKDFRLYNRIISTAEMLKIVNQ